MQSGPSVIEQTEATQHAPVGWVQGLGVHVVASPWYVPTSDLLAIYQRIVYSDITASELTLDTGIMALEQRACRAVVHGDLAPRLRGERQPVLAAVEPRAGEKERSHALACAGAEQRILRGSTAHDGGGAGAGGRPPGAGVQYEIFSVRATFQQGIGRNAFIHALLHGIEPGSRAGAGV